MRTLDYANPLDLSLLFFFQLAVIMVVSRLVSAVLSRLGQSVVVAEMVAGILLGPSLLGWLAPGLSSRLFPTESRACSPSWLGWRS